MPGASGSFPGNSGCSNDRVNGYCVQVHTAWTAKSVIISNMDGYDAFIAYNENVLDARSHTTLFRRRFSSEYGVRPPVAFEVFSMLNFDYNRYTNKYLKFRIAMYFLKNYSTEEQDKDKFKLGERTIRDIRRQVITEISELQLVSYTTKL